MEVSVRYDFVFILFCFINAGIISHVARYAPLHPAFLKQNKIKLFLNTYLFGDNFHPFQNGLLVERK